MQEIIDQILAQVEAIKTDIVKVDNKAAQARVRKDMHTCLPYILLQRGHFRFLRPALTSGPPLLFPALRAQAFDEGARSHAELFLEVSGEVGGGRETDNVRHLVHAVFP